MAPAAVQSTTAQTANEIRDIRRAAIGLASCHASVFTGRGLPTREADKMSFENAEAGACGTIIFWKQVGQSSCVPLLLEAAVMCCPHTGQANLNSLIALAKTIPHPATRDNVLLRESLVRGSVAPSP